jgi:cell division control protein 6
VATLHPTHEEETPARVREIYPRNRAIAGHSAIDPVVRRRIHDHLADLAMLDRQSRNEGRHGGQYYEYEFSVDLRTVREVVRELERLTLPQRVRHRP